MSKEVMIGMLKVANNGDEMLQILDGIVGNPPYADSSSAVSFQDAISSYAVDFKGNLTDFWWYWEGDTFSPFFSNNYLQKVLKNVYKWLNKYTLPFYLVENSSLDTTQ